MANMAPIQIENMHGQVADTINNHYQHTHHHCQTVHVHVVPPPFALTAPPAPPARSRGRLDKGRPEVTPAQRAVLTLMRPLPKPLRIALLDWMRCEFGTALVMDLDPRELHRLRAHLVEVRREAGVSG